MSNDKKVRLSDSLRPAISMLLSRRFEQVLVPAAMALAMAIGMCAGCRRNPPAAATRKAPSHKSANSKPNQSPFTFDPVTRSPIDDPADSHRKMLKKLEFIRTETNETDSWLGDAELRRKTQQLESLTSLATPKQQFELRVDVAKLQLRMGREPEAIKNLLEAEAFLANASHGSQLSLAEARQFATDVNFELGVAHMRLAETENCCSRHNPDSCLVPIRGGGIHTNTRGAREAIKRFEYVLNHAEPQSADWLRAVWLLNVAHMTLGEYPNHVAEKWRMPESMFQSSEPFPEFMDVAQDRHVDTFSLSGGVIADDFDGDGDFDLVVSSMETNAYGQLRYFSNDGSGNFVEHTQAAGLTSLLGGLNLVQADYNNDGFLDVYVLRGGWLQSAGRHPNSLLRNNGDGTFTDVSLVATVDGNDPTQTAAWADFDHDGDLDLYVGNEYTRNVGSACQLFRNNADGTFTDVAQQAGVQNRRFAKSVVWGDYDHDGWADLFVSNFGGPNRLYRNQGDGNFEDKAEVLGVSMPLRSFPSWFWDFNNDGRLDLFVAGYADDVAYEVAEQLGMTHDGERSLLFQNIGEQGFKECAKDCSVDAPVAPMGSNFGDLDNDGFLDFYLGTGEPEFRNLMPNRMYHNQQGARFVDVTMSGRFGHLQKGHGVVFADLDGDGDQDVFEQMGGAFPGDRYYDVLFDNPGFGKNHLAVRLVGVTSDRQGVGARICVVVEAKGEQRRIYRTVNSGGTFGANPLTQWFGLGDAIAAVTVEVWWPTTGKTQVLHDIDANQLLRIVEMDE